MKTKALPFAALLWLALLQPCVSEAQSGAFTYQGRLANATDKSPATGTFDLRFALFDAASDGSEIGDAVTNAAIAVNKGLFAVSLDFGPNAFNGAARWLQIGVRTNGGGEFRILPGRQLLTAAPSALFAARAGEVAWSNVTGLPADFADGVDNIANYTAGAGLSLVGSEISVNFAGDGVANSAARSDHGHLWSSLGGIPAGFADGVDNDTTYGAGAGLGLAGTVFSVAFAGNGSADMAARSDHSHITSWTNLVNTPADFADGVDNDTTYSAGTGLGLAGTVFSVSFGTNGAATTAARSDHDHLGQTWFSWTNLANIPAAFADGVDDTANFTAGAGVTIAGSQISVEFSGNGAANSAARGDHSHLTSWTNLVNTPAGFADGIDNDTTYSAGVGLGLTGTVFSVSFGTNGAATTAARSDHDHVAQGWFSWTNLANIPADFADGVDNGTVYSAGVGLTLAGSVFNVNFAGDGVAASAARSDHSHLWSNLGGIPAGFADGIDNDTTYSAGNGLGLAGTVFSVNFAGNGAATTASRSDHSHITSWTNLVNTPAGFADGIDNDTIYTAGLGLGLTGTVFSVSFGTNGIAPTAARSDHDHVGQTWLNWTNLAGIPAAFADGVDDTANYTAGAGLTIAGSEISVNFAGSGAALTASRSDHGHLWSSLSGIPAGFSDGIDDNTTYSAGLGLGLAGTVFNVAFAGNGAANTAARSDHSHITSWTNLVNTPAGFADGVDNDTTYTAGNGLGLTGSVFSVTFAGNGAANSVARSDHAHITSWTDLVNMPPGFADGTDNDTTYSAGAGLGLAGTLFSVNFGGNGAAATVARSDHSHVTSWTNLVNTPAGFADGVDNDTLYTAGAGLSLVGTVFGVNFGTNNGSSTTVARGDHHHHGQSWVGTNYNGLSLQTTATNGNGLYALANEGDQAYGVFGESAAGFGVVGSGGGYGLYGYSANGYAIFAQSGGGLTTPQLAVLQENTVDSCRLRMGVSGRPQWQLAVTPTATPAMNFYNGSSNVMTVSFTGAVTAQSFNPTSDRTMKENFERANPREVLARVERLPIQTWNFKSEPEARHIGPIAQDFHAAFQFGADDRHIATVDADGVALAAIQGLNEVVKEKEARIETLERRLAELEKLVASLARW